METAKYRPLKNVSKAMIFPLLFGDKPPADLLHDRTEIFDDLLKQEDHKEFGEQSGEDYGEEFGADLCEGILECHADSGENLPMVERRKSQVIVDKQNETVKRGCVEEIEQYERVRVYRAGNGEKYVDELMSVDHINRLLGPNRRDDILFLYTKDGAIDIHGLTQDMNPRTNGQLTSSLKRRVKFTHEVSDETPTSSQVRDTSQFTKSRWWINFNKEYEQDQGLDKELFKIVDDFLTHRQLAPSLQKRNSLDAVINSSDTKGNSRRSHTASNNRRSTVKWVAIPADSLEVVDGASVVGKMWAD